MSDEPIDRDEAVMERDEVAIHGMLCELNRGGRGSCDEAFVARVVRAIEEPEATKRKGTFLGGAMRWLVPLAAAASVAVMVGLWWAEKGRQTAGLGLRVVDVEGKCSVSSVRSSYSGNRGPGGITPGSRSPESTHRAPVVVGMEIRRGDRVVVTSGGKVGLKYDGEATTIDLHSAVAAFSADQGAKRVTLDSGLLLCAAAPQAKPFRLQTPNGAVTVVGTRFALSAGETETRLVVSKGRVNLARGAETKEVTEGQSAVASAQGVRLFAPAGAPLPPDKSASRKVRMGVNVCEWGGAGMDYAAEKIWADAMRSHRQWGRPDANDAPVPLDQKGWPITDASCLVYHGLLTGNNHGTYRLSFDCANPEGVTIAEKWAGGVILGKTNVGTRVSCRFVISDTNNSQCLLQFQKTAGGVRNVKLMRPVSPGSATSYPEDTVFTAQLLAAVKPFHVIRYMQWMGINLPLRDSTWADRTSWRYATQRGIYTPGWGVPGPSWESVIKFANASGKDAWICLPIRADDDYVRNLAMLLRDGNADCEPLRTDVNLYLEYGHEIWNAGPWQVQWAWITNAAVSVPELRLDGMSDPASLALRYQGLRSVKISEIFRSVFGDAAMMTRIRPLVCHQQGNAEAANRTMTFLDRYCGRRDLRSSWSNPYPLNRYFYGFGCGSFYSPADVAPALTLDNIWSSGGFAATYLYNTLKPSAALARMYGLEFVSCQSGPHPMFTGGEEVVSRAIVDPRMRAKQNEMQRVFEQLGGELSVLHTLIDKNLSAAPRKDESRRGLIRGDIGNTAFPRYQSVLDILSSEPAPITLGSLAPFTRPGADADMDTDKGSPSDGTLPLAARSSVYASAYCFRVPAAGIYGISANYSTGSRATLVAELDGSEIASWSLNPTGGSRPATTPTVFAICMPERLHAVRFVVTEGGIHLASVAVESGRLDAADAP